MLFWKQYVSIRQKHSRNRRIKRTKGQEESHRVVRSLIYAYLEGTVSLLGCSNCAHSFSATKFLTLFIRGPYTIVYDSTRWYTTVYGCRISPYTEQRRLPLNHSVFVYDLRIRNPFLTVSLRIRASYMEAVYDLRISPFFSVNGRLRPCMFDLGIYVENALDTSYPKKSLIFH